MALVSRRMRDVQIPVIPWVGDLIRSTPGTISLGQGVVDYAPPAAAHEALVRFCEEPARHKYQHEQGIPELRERIAARVAAENGIEVDRFSLMVTAGGNMAFLTALLAICDEGDEVVLVRPYFFNHEMAVRIIGCRPVVAAADERYQLDLAAIEASIGPRTRAVVTVSPNNPSGAVYPESDLRAVNALCAERGLFHVSDEVYEYFLFDGARHFSPGAIAGAENHTVCIYSLSKSYGFASWRVGYMLLPPALLEAAKKIQDTNVICAPVVSQHAAVGVLDAGRGWVEERLKSIAEVRGIALDALSGLGDRVTVPRADGAFYFLLRVHGGGDSEVLAERLIREHRIAVVPGTTFGMSDGCYLRMGYGAVDAASMKEAMARLTAGIVALEGYSRARGNPPAGTAPGFPAR